MLYKGTEKTGRVIGLVSYEDASFFAYIFFLNGIESSMDDHLIWVRWRAHRSSLNADVTVIRSGIGSTWGFFESSPVIQHSLGSCWPRSHPGNIEAKQSFDFSLL